jgi:hypothetical protein
MLVRILQFLVGAALGGGGGYLAWLNRFEFGAVFPPGPGGPPWMLVLGILGVASGIVFLVSAVHPRPNQRAALAARAQQRETQLNEAETYYAEAGRAADRDWRSGDIPPPVAPAAPVAPVMAAPVVEPAPVAPAPVVAAPPPPQPVVPPPAPPPVAPPPPPPVAPPAPPPVAQAPVSAPPAFPSTASLAPIPQAAEPPPAPVTIAASVAPAAAPGPHDSIRAAIRDGRLDEAERLLEAGRETAEGAALAELTGLAGDHAAAAGRQSHAKWLWRLAVKRFGEAGAMDTPAARAVTESLRTSG